MLFDKLNVGKYFVFCYPGPPMDVLHVFRKTSNVQIAAIKQGTNLEEIHSPNPYEANPDDEVSQLWI